jgi:hypothetical protein
MEEDEDDDDEEDEDDEDGNEDEDGWLDSLLSLSSSLYYNRIHNSSAIVPTHPQIQH